METALNLKVFQARNFPNIVPPVMGHTYRMTFDKYTQTR